MKELIQQIDGWQDLTAEQIRAALVASDPQRRPASESTYNAQDLLGTIDPDAVETLMASLRGAGYQVTANAIESTEGLDFGHPNMQAKLDSIGEAIAAFTPEMVNALKSLGVDFRSKWQRAKGDATEPTMAEVANAKQSAAAELFAETLAQRVGAAIRLAAAADGAAEQSIRDAAIAEVQT